MNYKLKKKPATPLTEEDISFLVPEVLSNVGVNKARKLSQTPFRPEETSGLIPKGSKTDPLWLRRNSNQMTE